MEGKSWENLVTYVCDVRLREDLKGNICPRLEVGAFARQYQCPRTPKMVDVTRIIMVVQCPLVCPPSMYQMLHT